jgi:hypothetical protein
MVYTGPQIRHLKYSASIIERRHELNGGVHGNQTIVVGSALRLLGVQAMADQALDCFSHILDVNCVYLRKRRCALRLV